MTYNTTYLPFDQLTNGSIVTSVVNVYDNAMGGLGFFWVLVYIIIIIIVGVVTDDSLSVGMASVLGALVFTPLIPASTLPIFYTISVLSLAISLYRGVKSQ